MTKKTTQPEFAIGDEVTYSKIKGTTFVIVAIVKGWITIENEKGPVKVRAKDLRKAETMPTRMAEKLARARVRYEPTVAYSGAKSLSNGDDVAHHLSGMTPEETILAAEILLGLDEGFLMAKYAHLNPGQMRMNASNRIRGAINRGDNTVDDVARVLSALH
jgi:hypothetical protein